MIGMKLHNTVIVILAIERFITLQHANCGHGGVNAKCLSDWFSVFVPIVFALRARVGGNRNPEIIGINQQDCLD